MSVIDSAVGHVTDSPVASKDGPPLLLVLPGLFVLLTLTLSPILYLVYLSFANAEPATLFQGKEQWASLASYATVLLDGQFWSSMGMTWLFVATSVVLKVFADLGVGLVVTGERVRGKRFMRALIIIPFDLPGIFITTIRRGIFSPAEFGFADQFLQMTGLDSIAWLSERWMAFLAYDVTEAWLVYPLMVIITVSALQGVPEEPHRVAVIDGADFFTRFLHVMPPPIKRPVLFASILTAVTSFQQLFTPHVFNQGGSSRTNRLFIVYGYREVFHFRKYGEGATITLIAMTVTGVFVILDVEKRQLADGVDDVWA